VSYFIFGSGHPCHPAGMGAETALCPEAPDTGRESPMFLGPIITVMVVAYISIVALGHVLLIVAILKCLREDFGGGRGRRAGVADRPMAGPDAEPVPAC
jgi:hypothetical protein